MSLCRLLRIVSPRAVLAIVIGPIGSAAPVADSLTTTMRREQRQEVRLLIELLQGYQYAGRQLQDLDSAEIIDAYLRRLDPSASILTSEDVASLHRRYDRTLKSVYLAKGDVQPAYDIFDTFNERAQSRLDWIRARLSAGLDFAADESMVIVPESESKPPADATEADRRWEDRLKATVLSAVVRGVPMKEAGQRTERSFHQWGTHLMSMDAIAVRESFLDAFIQLFDPHSGYFSAEDAAQFQLAMRGAVTGVGLMVRLDEGRCMVERLLPGGAAERQGRIRRGDELLSIAENAGGPVPMTGRRIGAAIGLLHGPAGSEVRLTLRHAAGTADELVRVTRSELVLVENRARGMVCCLPTERSGVRRIGWLSVPAFYAVEPDSGGSSLTRDLRELIDLMSRQSLDGIVLDLRGNPGGAITEALGVAGLFVSAGPVVLIRRGDASVETMNVARSGPVFDQPLVVLLSRDSASASEVLAGALRVRRRALIVGASATFGKGTAQLYVDLNKHDERPVGAKLAWGTLRLTAERFYYPDGTSPQFTGVVPDIVLPMIDSLELKTERDLPHALPSETIPAAHADWRESQPGQLTSELLATLRTASSDRVAHLPEFELERRFREMRQARRRRTSVSLNLEIREAEQAAEDQGYQGWLEQRRALVARDDWKWEQVDTEAVRQVLDAHWTAALQNAGPEVNTSEGAIYGGAFLFVDHGRRCEYDLDRVAFRSFVPQVATIAAKMTQAAGRPVDRANVESFLRALDAMELRTPEAIDRLFAISMQRTALQYSEVRSALHAALRHLATIEPALTDRQSGLDVPAREALRLAANWASIVGAASPNSRLPSAGPPSAAAASH